MFVALDSTFGAFARVARPFIQETISETPPTLDTLTRTAPRIRTFLGHSATLFADLRPGIKALSENSPAIASALETGAERAAGRPAAQRPARADRAGRSRRSRRTRASRAGVRRSTQFFDFLTPTLRFVTPAQTFCNYAIAAAPQRAEPAQPGRRDRHLAAVHRHVGGQISPFARDRGPEQREQPVLGARERPGGVTAELPARQPVPVHRGARAAARVRGRQREVHPGQGRDRQPAPAPGDDHGEDGR